MESNLFKNGRDLDAIIHGSFKDRGFAAVVDLPRKCLSLCHSALERLDELSDHFFERVDLIVEKYHLCGCLDERVAVRHVLDGGLLVHCTYP